MHVNQLNKNWGCLKLWTPALDKIGFICFIESPLKMKNKSFYLILKFFFYLKEHLH